jgi:tRNA (cmo5U34)-methyltransferase
MRHRAPAGSRIIAIDNAPAMIEQAQKNIAADRAAVPVNVLCADLRTIAFESPLSLATFNLTLQFIPADERTALLARIAQAMMPGGALILSEKIQVPNDCHDRLLIDLHHGFKRAQGYSDMEIAQKRSALDNVLIPDTLDTHIARLHEAGFTHVAPWFQCFNFMSLLAVR